MPLDLNDPETKKEVEALVAEATKGLTNNRDEILGEKKALQQKLESFSGVSPDEYKALKNFKEEAERQKLVDKGEYEKALADSNRSKDEALKRLETGLAQRDNYIKAMGLQKALIEANVKEAPLLEAATAMFAPKLQLLDDETGPVVKLDDKPINDYIKEWAGTDKGKFFVSAPVNQGGGTPPGAQIPGNGAGLRKSQMNLKQRSGFIGERGLEAYESLPD